MNITPIGFRYNNQTMANSSSAKSKSLPFTGGFVREYKTEIAIGAVFSATMGLLKLLDVLGMFTKG